MVRIAFLVLLPTLVQAAAPILVPRPRSMQTEPGSLVIKGRLGVRMAPDTPGNRFAMLTLGGELARGQFAVVPTQNPAVPHLLAGLAGDLVIGPKLGARKLTRPESYILRITSAGILLAGADEAGVFYGIQTLRQLANVSGGQLTLPFVSIDDEPALRYRGLSVDISRGPVLTQEQLKSVIRTLSEFKMNMLTLYMEHVFPYEGYPLVAPEGTGISPASMKSLSEYAARYHVDLVPQQQTFGHLHHMLKVERYSDMAETPHGSVLAVEDERGYEWIGGAARTLASVFRSRFLHIGSDETLELGKGRTRELAERVGTGEAYLVHMRRVNDMLAPLNRKLMFWGDIALSHPELISKLPKNLVAMTWDYDAKPDYSPSIKPFRDSGMEVFVCPGLNNWSRIYPGVDEALQNINGFVRDGKRLGAIGMLNTHWNDEGEVLFNPNWYGIVFSAAAAWQDGPVDTNAFAGAFDWAFHRNRGSKAVATVIGRFARAHQLLRDAGLKYAGDQLFWMDPFTRLGTHYIKAAWPVASELRKLAEENMIDVAAIEPGIQAHRETLVFLYLASRRLDYLGMKVQFSKYMADRYRAALARGSDQRAARLELKKITSTNGYVEDLRAAILEIKPLYRRAWLAENQPYWLDNVLVKYDAEALYWQQKANLISRVLQEFLLTNEIPRPEQLGLVLPE